MTAHQEQQDILPQMLGRDVLPEIINSLDKLVSYDKRLRTYVFLHALSTYTLKPANLGIEAPSSEGKTYPTLKILSLFPNKDVWKLGGLSPTALAHDYGVLVDENGNSIEGRIRELRELMDTVKDKKAKRDIKRQIADLMKRSKNLINLEGRIIVFLEDPHPDTWAKLRPILSHDSYEIEYKYTDRRLGKGPLAQLTSILRGWPVFIYFKAEARSGRSLDIWDQIITRFTTISPEMHKLKYRGGVMIAVTDDSLPTLAAEKYFELDKVLKASQMVKLIKERLLEIKSKIKSSKLGDMFWCPFYKKIGSEFPAHFGRRMRDSKRFMVLLKMSAAANVYNRPILNIDGVEYIIVTKTDYEIAKSLFLSGLELKTVFTGLPAHVIRFFDEVLKPKCEEKPDGVKINELLDDFKKVFEKSISGDGLRKHYLRPLEKIGWVTHEPDPDDKRFNLYRVVGGEEISGIYRRFQNAGIFTLENLKDAWDELKQITDSKCKVDIYNFDGTPLTIEDLYKIYYSKIQSESAIYLRGIQPPSMKIIDKLAALQKSRYLPVILEIVNHLGKSGRVKYIDLASKFPTEAVNEAYQAEIIDGDGEWVWLRGALFAELQVNKEEEKNKNEEQNKEKDKNEEVLLPGKKGKCTTCPVCNYPYVTDLKLHLDTCHPELDEEEKERVLKEVSEE